MIPPAAEDLDLANELLQGPISAQGAYNIGLVTGLALDAGWHPDHFLLRNVATAESTEAAIEVFRAWLREVHP